MRAALLAAAGAGLAVCACLATERNDTPFLQARIDAVAAKGGGEVVVPRGEYIVATLRLRDNITLRLEKDAYLYGSTNREAYASYRNEGDTIASVVSAEGVTNVAIVGEGTIDGRGRLHDRVLKEIGPDKWYLEPGRNVAYFHGCRNVRIEGVTLRCGSSWTCHLRDCDGVVARNVRIWSHCQRSNDGFDVESKNVLIEDCDVDTEDDSLAIKARTPESVVENVVVRRCRFSTNAEHIKIGTETLGTIRNVLVEDCDVACRTPMVHAEPWARLGRPGTDSVQCALSAISLLLVDGGSVEDVTIRDIRIGEGIMTPVCLRYGDRKPRRLPGRGFFRNVLVERVKMSSPSTSAIASSITGVPGFRIENITFRDCKFVVKGGGRAEDAAEKIVNEHAADYPYPWTLESMLPAWGFYMRHADGIRFEDVEMECIDRDEARPCFKADDATYEVLDAKRTESRRAPVAVHPQSFDGGWAQDCQFIDVIGSPCLVAHGMGRPVPDSRAVVELPEAGRWRVAVRTKNWLPEDCSYPASAAVYPGSFRVLVDGRPLDKVFGRGPKAWTWEDGGEVDCASRRVTVALRDEDGFDGRCAGVVFYRGEFPFARDAALDVRGEPVAERSSYDLVVVGGGVPGCCAAVAAAREGIRVALVQDRPVLGGNSSSEIRVYSAGEQRHPIVKEMRSLFMNRDADNAVSDAVRLSKLEREPNLSVFLSHRVFAAEKDGACIRAARAIDLARNRVVAFEGRYFVDATGDGWLGFYAGAEYRQGREAKDEFGESFAPDRADRQTLGASLMWKSSEANVDVPFAAPWAEPYACGVSVVNGEWNWEYGLDRDVITEGEQVRDRLLLAIYGAFSNAKRDPANSRRILTTLPLLLGKRESRRLVGDWVYRQSDVEGLVQFEDAVATGSWSIDLHYVIDPKVPFLTRCEQPHYGRYWIPYRSIYSRNVDNLFMAGRCFSCTHVGLGGPRVINTLSQLGVAAGIAAAMCCERGETPRQLHANGRMRELQRRIGGDWPGNPDPARRDWAVVDDEDESVTFIGDWEKGFQCNGGQVGNACHTCLSDGGGDVRAVYPLPVARPGRYRLMGNTPWCWGTERYGLGEVVLKVVSGVHTNSVVWNQAAGNGDWVDLGVLELRCGATLTVLPGESRARTVFADGFALVPNDGQ